MGIPGKDAPSQGKDSQGENVFALHPLSSLFATWNIEIVSGNTTWSWDHENESHEQKFVEKERRKAWFLDDFFEQLYS